MVLLLSLYFCKFHSANYKLITASMAGSIAFFYCIIFIIALFSLILTALPPPSPLGISLLLDFLELLEVGGTNISLKIPEKKLEKLSKRLKMAYPFLMKELVEANLIVLIL
jgi:hypothetical protein